MANLDNGNGNGNGMISGPDGEFLRRLERSFDIQEKEYQKTRDDVTGLKSQQNNILRDISSLSEGIKNLSIKIDERSKLNWPAFAVAVPLFIACMTLAGVVLTTYTSAAVAPAVNVATVNTENIKHLTDNMHAVETSAFASQASDAASRTDRQQLNDRVRIVEGAVASGNAEHRALSASVKVSIAEIEAQFCASDIVRNLMHANDMRMIAMLWRKASGGAVYPTDNAFYPTICRRDAAAAG